MKIIYWKEYNKDQGILFIIVDIQSLMKSIVKRRSGIDISVYIHDTAAKK